MNVRNSNNSGYPASFPAIHDFFNNPTLDFNIIISLYIVIFKEFIIFLETYNENAVDLYLKWYEISSAEDFQLSLLLKLKEYSAELTTVTDLKIKIVTNLKL